MVRVIGLIAVLAGGPIAGSQSTPPKAPPGCRTYSTHETRAIATPLGPAATVVQKCAYNRATNQFTCRGDHRSAASTYAYEMTFTFATVDDFLGNPDRVILFGHPQRMTMRHTGAGVNLLSHATYTYDAAGRLTRLATDTAGRKHDEIFTAWDSVGRPTAATAGAQIMAYSYDDAKRIGRITNKGAGTVVVKRFDVNGIEIGDEQSGPAGTVTNTWTIHSTATICR
jgi:YD repeat-containing protein